MIGPPPPRPFDPSTLRLGRDLRRAGVEPHAPEFRRIRRGVWMTHPDWVTLTPTQRHAALVHATALMCALEQPPVFSHAAAAAVWGMPRIQSWPDLVDIVTSDRRIRTSGRINRHVGHPAVAQTTGGLHVTSPARTVIDLARTLPLVDSLAAVDHALRHGLCRREDLILELAEVMAPAPGRHRAEVVCELANPLSMSAGESLSRAQMFLLCLPPPQLQVPIHDALGHIGTVDFLWSGLIGEFDGRVKYGVSEGMSSDEAAGVLWAEKQREDRLRRKVPGFARWTMAIALNQHRFGLLLAEKGLRPERRNTWLAG